PVVEVLGSARIKRHDDGTLVVQLRDLGNNGRLHWEDVPGSVVVLSGMPFAFLWLGLISNAALVEILQNARRLDMQLHDGDAGAYANELFGHFRRRIARHADLREMRRNAARAL